MSARIGHIEAFLSELAQVPVSSQGTPTVQNAHQLEWERRDPANILTMESGGGRGRGGHKGTAI